MNTRLGAGRLSALLMLAVVGCAGSDPVQPPIDAAEAFEEADLLTLELLEDVESTDAALALVEVEASGSDRIGLVRTQGDDAHRLAAEARMRFGEARAALARGDQAGAIANGREARHRVALAVEALRGRRGSTGLVERARDLADRVRDLGAHYVDADRLRAQLDRFADRARDRLSAGDAIGAARLGVLAEQLHDARRRRDAAPDVRIARVRLAVGLADAAVALADRLLGERGADDEHLRLLRAAVEYQSAAHVAFDEGAYRRAMHFAELAHWTALQAVVLPGGVTLEEARAMHSVAVHLYEEAAAAIGDPPTDLRVDLLGRARHLIAAGEAHLAEGNVRGIGPLWRAAVICAWLIG